MYPWLHLVYKETKRDVSKCEQVTGDFIIKCFRLPVLVTEMTGVSYRLTSFVLLKVSNSDWVEPGSRNSC
jgi:hypothetical protein